MSTITGLGQRTGDRADTMIHIDIPVRQIIEACHRNNTTTVVHSDNWICAISQPHALSEDGHENDLEITVTLARPRSGEGQVYSCALLQYSHLSVLAPATDNDRLGSIRGRDGENEQGRCLQEVAICRPEMLLQGVKVYVEPRSVRCGQRYAFDVQLYSNEKKRVKMQLRQQKRPSQLHCHPYPRTLPAPSPLAQALPSISAFQTSEVFTVAKHRLKEFLERSRGADIKITFSQEPTTASLPPSSLSPLLTEHSLLSSTMAADLTHACISPDVFQQHGLMQRARYCRTDAPAALLVHSCVLSTVSSPAMRSLLNTNPPPPPPPPPTPLPPSGSLTPSIPHIRPFATHETPCMISSSGQSPLSVTPTDCSHPALFELNRYHDPAQQQPVRTIQFEDSCPEAVHAVIRYIYLGQKPVLEPYCGYTVKDLMALASYLQIPPLEEYCVQLVIGTHRDTTASASEDEYGSDILNCYSSIHSHRHTRRQQLQSRISPEMAVQVLFDWGYKYPKIRTTLVCALIDSELFSDEDMLCGQEVEEGGGGGLLRSFAGHEAFHSILCEIVERQLTRRLV